VTIVAIHPGEQPTEELKALKMSRAERPILVLPKLKRSELVGA
jgi:hypothetical protein